MRASTIVATLAACVLAAAALTGTSLADDTRACPEVGLCVTQRAGLDVDRVTCLNELGGQTDVWVCRYEIGYSCFNEEDQNERESGGLAPLDASLCDHLCGQCPSEWRKVEPLPTK